MIDFTLVGLVGLVSLVGLVGLVAIKSVKATKADLYKNLNNSVCKEEDFSK